MKALTKKEELLYMDVALRISGANFDKLSLDMFVTLSRELRKMGGDLDMKTVCKLREQVFTRHTPKSKNKKS